MRCFEKLHMLNDICSIRIDGQYFSPNYNLKFFDKNNICLIYGRNGSGKSTIAKAFNYLKVENSFFNSVKVYADNNEEVILSTEDKNKLFVFDEDFILNNIRLKESELDTIVILGKQVELLEKKEKLENDIKVKKDEYEKAFEEHNRVYADSKSDKSPDYYKNKMCNSLKGDDSWSGRDKKIRQGKINSPVSKDTYKQFLDSQTTETKNELLKEFDELYQKLESSRKENVQKISESVPIISENFTSYDSQNLSSLLSTKIETPILTEREKKLLRLVKEGHGDFVNKIKIDFSDPKVNICPFCFQSISNEYKNGLIKNIENVLDEKVKDHVRELSSFKLEEINPIDKSFNELKSYDACCNQLNLFNHQITYINEQIDQKVKNPFEPICVDIPSISSLALDLQKSIQNLDEEKRSYNKCIDEQDILKTDLMSINAKIAYLDIENDYKNMKKQDDEKRSSSAYIDKLWKDKALLEGKYDDLISQMNSVDIAVEEINESLGLIFFSKDRLQIKSDVNGYTLLSNGKSVSPNNVSTGERNIIALCYFFASILNGKDEKSAYNSNYLFVIDDPISSFDHENKIGVISFFNSKLSLFIRGNDKTKFIVLTHDFGTFLDLETCLKSSLYDLKDKIKLNMNRLVNKKLEDVNNEKDKFEYSYLLKLVYDFANNNTNDNEIIIGNVMRQVLEAFSTFLYRKGIGQIVSNNELEKIMSSNREFIPYFANSMIPLVLNGGSHRKEQVYSMNDNYFFEYISKDDKIRIAKSVLCFLFLINPQHILHHLDNQKEANSDLRTWCDEIKNNYINSPKDLKQF